MIGLVLAGLALAALGGSDSGGGAAPPSADQTQTAPRAPLVLAIGSIHGNEAGGIEVIEATDGAGPARGELVVVANLNPDGLARGTRTNGRGVDLNRNFASGWRPIGVAGDPEHSGPRPFSEPESRFARRLIRRLQPDVTVWFHQQNEPPLVRAWGPSVPAARSYARLAGSRFNRVPWLPGSAPNWQNHRFPGTSSFVVELPWGNVPRAEVERHAAALLALGRALEGAGA